MISFFNYAFSIGADVPQGKTDTRVKVVVPDVVDDNLIYYVASAPADYRTSFTGSGRPFANPEQAFQNTPNKGSAKLQGGAVVIDLQFPNSFYKELGTKLIQPSLYISYKTGGKQKVQAVVVSSGIPYRSYTSKNTGPLFYQNKLVQIQSQWQTLVQTGYPRHNKEHDNHWGIRPPV